MKTRIRSIFILMTVCILGINLFQGYWLFTTYTFHRQQFYRGAMEALQAAIFRYQEADVRQLFTQDSARLGKDGPRRVLVQRFKTTEKERTANDLFIVGAEQELQTNLSLPEGPKDYLIKRQLRFNTGSDTVPGPTPADTLARRISRRILVNWTNQVPFNMEKMDSAYRQELKFRGIAASFRLDSLHLPAQQINISTQKATSLTAEEVAFSLKLPLVPINPIQNLFLQASFPQPGPYILKKMGGLLAGSVLLLLLTTGCFLYMLATILRQKKLSEVKNDFINNMTHELKTPLATVSAAVEALLSFGALNDAQKTRLYLTVSQNELQRLSGLVEKVLQMAVAEQKELQIQPEPIRPTEIIREVVGKYQLEPAKPVQFTLNLADEEKIIKADQLHLENAISNLIDNALKYSGEEVNIAISSYYDGQSWQLRVKDNGIGIPKTYQKAIFERFFRVPTGNLHPVKGFGLGLSYVKQVVEKHGGTILVRSEVGGGSEFIITLPTL